MSRSCCLSAVPDEEASPRRNADEALAHAVGACNSFRCSQHADLELHWCAAPRPVEHSLTRPTSSSPIDSAYLLASGGVNADQLSSNINTVNLAGTFEPLVPLSDTDVEVRLLPPLLLRRSADPHLPTRAGIRPPHPRASHHLGHRGRTPCDDGRLLPQPRHKDAPRVGAPEGEDV